MGNGCNTKCRLKCHTRLSEDERRKAKSMFDKLGDKVRQWTFISKLTNSLTKEDDSDSETQSVAKRNFYILPKIDGKKIKVCKIIFLHTFS